MLATGLRGFSGRFSLLGRGHPNLTPCLAVPVRGRKTRLDPPAKSKADRIKVPPPVDPAELLVILDRYEQYRRVVHAIRGQLREEILWKHYDERYGLTARLKNKAEDEEHQLLMAWNNAENKRLLVQRLDRLRQEEETRKAEELQMIQIRAAEEEEFRKMKEKEVLQLQEEAQHFITLENLDQRIEECLNRTRNYNFALDKEGRIAKRSILP